MSIKKEQNHFAASVKWAKLSTGLTDPIAGPILPKDDAAAPTAERKSKPNNVSATEDITKMSM